jgi:hypothetical protein
MKPIYLLAALALLAVPAYAAQQTIRNEGAFDYTIRKQVNDNFDELYAATLEGTSGLTTTTITATGAITDTRTPSADHASTLFSTKLLYTVPVHTTGTNTDYGLWITPTISNASGGTNVFKGLFLANITGDAQVTETALDIGTGYDVGVDVNSPANFDSTVALNSTVTLANAAAMTRAPTADSATTNNGVSIAFTTPVDTTGTNDHNGLIISPTIGNASGGTNTFDALEIGAITGDAQVTENAIKVGSGYDVGIVTDSSLKVNSTNGTAISAIRIGTDTDLDSGQTSEVVTVTGATSASLCFATITNDTTTEVSVTNVVAGTDQATVQVSADPSTTGADLAVICFN